VKLPPPPLAKDALKGDRGLYGELLATYYLTRIKELTLVESNWKTTSGPRGEIDLVMRDQAILVFVEVRARSRDALVSGAFSVRRKKRMILERTFKTYLRGMKPRPREFRFDIVEIDLPPFGREGVGILYHYPNVLLFKKDFRLTF
jgi:putative endonuclease